MQNVADVIEKFIIGELFEDERIPWMYREGN